MLLVTPISLPLSPPLPPPTTDYRRCQTVSPPNCKASYMARSHAKRCHTVALRLSVSFFRFVLQTAQIACEANITFCAFTIFLSHCVPLGLTNKRTQAGRESLQLSMALGLKYTKPIYLKRLFFLFFFALRRSHIFFCFSSIIPFHSFFIHFSLRFSRFTTENS